MIRVQGPARPRCLIKRRPPRAQALQLGHPGRDVRDTARFPPLMRAAAPGRRPRPRALRHLAAEHLGLAIQAGEHSPVDDARAALYLYQKHRRARARRPSRAHPAARPLGRPARSSSCGAVAERRCARRGSADQGRRPAHGRRVSARRSVAVRKTNWSVVPAAQTSAASLSAV